MAQATESLPQSPARPGTGIDRTVIRRLLAMTPAQRVDLLVREARNLAAFDTAFKKKP